MSAAYPRPTAQPTGATRARGAAAPPSGRPRGASVSGIPKVAETTSSVSTCSSGPAATTRPSRSSSTWVKPGGISSTWWETSTVAGRHLVHREHRQRRRRGPRGRRGRDRRPARRAAAAPGRSSAPGRSAPACARPRTACRRCGRPAGRRRPRASSSSARSWSRLVVLLAPPADHAVRRGHDDVEDPLVARDPLGQGGAGQADPGPQLEDVDGAEHLAEDARRRPEVGWIWARRDLQQRGLAGAVRAEHHPALVLLDRPVDAVEQDGLARVARSRRRARERRPCACAVSLVARRLGGLDLRPHTRGPAAGPTSRTLVGCRRCPVSARFALWFSAWLAGAASLDDTRDAIVGDDAAHDVVGRARAPTDSRR